MSDYAKALTEFWSAQGEAMLRAQSQAAQAMTEGLQVMASGRLPGMAGAVPDAAELSQAADAAMKLWSAAASRSAELGAELAAKLQAPAGGGERDATITALLGRIADPRQWMVGPSEMDEALGRMAEGPRLADLFDLERRYALVTKAWLELRRRSLEHNAVVLEAWTKAGKRFSEALSAQQGGAPLEPKQAMALWTEIANQHLLETQRGEPFLTSQREMIRATTDLRLAQQALVEHFGKQYGFPTRTEMDDLHRTVTTMRRELRTLRRAARAAATPQPAAAPPLPAPPLAAPARPSRSKATRDAVLQS